MTHSIKAKVEHLEGTTTRPMFGYQCYSVGGKFFVGFSKKDDTQVITKLPKEEQLKSLKTKGVKPFSHGAKAGWIEINTKESTVQNSMKWIKIGYENALRLEK
jgi:predicted DNA-binding protein (MmcQ/YjbR family)